MPTRDSASFCAHAGANGKAGEKYVPRKIIFKMLADEYNVCMQAISKIIYRQTWRHLE